MRLCLLKPVSLSGPESTKGCTSGKVSFGFERLENTFLFTTTKATSLQCRRERLDRLKRPTCLRRSCAFAQAALTKSSTRLAIWVSRLRLAEILVNHKANPPALRQILKLR